MATNTRDKEPTQEPRAQVQPATMPTRLAFRPVQQVVVTAEGDERFPATSQEAARACRTVLDQREWQEQFEGLLAHVHQWAEAHAEIVAGAYVRVGSDGLNVVVITTGDEYRLDFEDELTDLDIELANKYPACRADVLQSPETELETGIPSISPERSLQVHGHAIRPPQESRS